MEQRKIRVGNEQILVITVTLILRTVTQRETISYRCWYLYLLHWIVKSSIHLSCPQFFNIRPDLCIILLVITSALISRTVTQREISCHHWWYLCLLHWMVWSLIHLRCPRLVNSNPSLHRTLSQSFKLLKYMVGIHLICQITFHRRPPRMEVEICMDAWLTCLSWHRDKVS